MSSYQELLARQKALEEQIEAAHGRERETAIEEVRRIAADFGLGELELFGRSISRGGVSETAGRPLLAKYKDPETAKTWTGRGKPPSWIAGKDREPFLIR
ncbi:H-NS histone family protein [Xylophilus sp. GOD-11R]|uniref:H-NS histone family protein n=1 Tax=Xylophilus sp. GOD-11R TaxID=3089814 RepID=UPI00298BD7AB|nr:H-NS histone family protein [Xylophilus sp. GOD-11R]WPB55805.1 H-NS histone family protein [Xylophilus sp. GOD-11R]